MDEIYQGLNYSAPGSAVTPDARGGNRLTAGGARQSGDHQQLFQILRYDGLAARLGGGARGLGAAFGYAGAKPIFGALPPRPSTLLWRHFRLTLWRFWKPADKSCSCDATNPAASVAQTGLHAAGGARWSVLRLCRCQCAHRRQLEFLPASFAGHGCGVDPGNRLRTAPGQAARTFCLHHAIAAFAASDGAFATLAGDALMQYPSPLQQALLIRRYKRFLADVEVARWASYHGSLSEHRLHAALRRTWLVGCGYWTVHNPKRKYRHSWEWVEVDQQHLACINTQRAQSAGSRSPAGGSHCRAARVSADRKRAQS